MGFPETTRPSRGIRSLLIAPLMFALASCTAWAQSTCQAPQSNWQDFRCRTLSPGTVLWPAFSATRGYIFDHTDGYSSRPSGFAYRFGVSLADNVDGKFMSSLLMPTLSGHRREPYHYIGANHEVDGRRAGVGKRSGTLGCICCWLTRMRAGVSAT